VRPQALVFWGVVVPISSRQRALQDTALPLVEMFEDSVAMVEVRLTPQHPIASLYTSLSATSIFSPAAYTVIAITTRS